MLATLISCGGDSATPTGPPTGTPTGTGSGSGSGATETAPRATLPDDPDALRLAILDRAHGKRRGQFDRATLELRAGADATVDNPPIEVQAALPALRIRRPDGTLLGADGSGDRWVREPGAAAREASASEQATISSLRLLVRALSLQPLERASSSAYGRTDATTGPQLLLEQPDGTTWTALLDATVPGVEALETGDARIEFVRFHDTGQSRAPLQVRQLDAASDPVLWNVRFQDTDLRVDSAVFERPLAKPEATDGDSGQDTELIVIGPDQGIGEVREVQAPAVRLLWVPDDGSWDSRMQSYGSAGSRLGPAGYQGGGDPILAHDADRDWFVIPFVAGPGRTEPVSAGEGERLTELPDHRRMRYSVPFGPFDARLATGRKVLAAALEAHPEWRTEGPLFVAINLHGRRPDEDPDCLDDALLEMSYRIVDR